MGKPPRRLGGLRVLVKSLGQATHQLARASSGLANLEAFATSVAGHCCGCHFRQFHHGCLYQQGGQDPVPVSVPSGTGCLGMVQATRQECSCRFLVQGEQPSPDGVDPPQHGDQSNLSTLANPACGPVRVGEEPQDASVLLNPAVPVIERCECANAELGMPLRICISTDGTRPESVAEVEASTDGPDPTGGPVLAQPAVVPPTDVDADGSAPAISQRDDLLKNVVRGMRYPKPEAMRLSVWPLSANPSLTAAFQQTLLNADTAARARRESTCWVYGSRLRHYQRWCVDRGVDPVKAPLTEVAEFLENLQTIWHKGNPLPRPLLQGVGRLLRLYTRVFRMGPTCL